jgi:hypothetical protein
MSMPESVRSQQDPHFDQYRVGAHTPICLILANGGFGDVGFPLDQGVRDQISTMRSAFAFDQ